MQSKPRTCKALGVHIRLGTVDDQGAQDMNEGWQAWQACSTGTLCSIPKHDVCWCSLVPRPLPSFPSLAVQKEGEVCVCVCVCVYIFSCE